MVPRKGLGDVPAKHYFLAPTLLSSAHYDFMSSLWKCRQPVESPPHGKSVLAEVLHILKVLDARWLRGTSGSLLDFVRPTQV